MIKFIALNGGKWDIQIDKISIIREHIKYDRSDTHSSTMLIDGVWLTFPETKEEIKELIRKVEHTEQFDNKFTDMIK